MDEEFLLLNPGPVPVSESVRTAIVDPMVSRRSAEFEAFSDALKRGSTASNGDSRDR